MRLVHTLARAATAPIRLGLSAGELGLSVARSVVGEARRAVTGAPARSAGWTRPRPPRVWSPGPQVREHSAVQRAPEAVDPPPVATPANVVGPAVPAIPPRGAKQVDDEPIPIAESAELGAEDGAGAEVHVDPPWDGYDAMTAADIRDRLIGADAGLAAAVALYEAAGRGRVSVVRAAERRLGALSA